MRRELSSPASGGATRPRVCWLDDAPTRPRRLALGTFDGVHLGHRRVIAGADTVVTFDPHPRAVVGRPPPLLHDLDSKVEALGGLGVAEVVLVPFDRDLAAMSPRRFVDEVLVGRLAATRVAVGENFHFGRGGAGGVADLLADRRFETEVEPLLVEAGEVVSSTRIRALLQAGKIDAAVRLLGAPFRSRCPLERNCGGGIRLRWPAGIVRPGPGAYAATVTASGESIAARVLVSAETAELFPSRPVSPAEDGSVTVALEGTVRDRTRDLVAAV